jgi:hypothetical protein
MRETFSVPYDTPVNQEIAFLNQDVLRTQVDISNLYNFGILQNVSSIVEVGGGYGHLAVAIKTMLPNIKYTILDLTLQNSLQNRWINHIAEFQNNPGLHSIDLVNVETNSDLQLDCDLIINVNSFCEMKESVVRSYIDGKRIRYDLLYSNNREKQFMNNSLSVPLSQIYSEYFSFTPKLSEYESSNLQFKKFVIVGGNLSKVNLLKPEQLWGITATKTPFNIN